MTESGVMNGPSVAEVIELLKKMPPDAKFVMEDADTSWDIRVIHYKLERGEVVFWGEYGEMG